MMSEATITLDSREEAILLFGSRDVHLKDIRTALGVAQLVGRGDQIIIKGTDDQLAWRSGFSVSCGRCCATKAASPTRT